MASSQIRILVVDDQQLMLRLLLNYLEETRYEVITADNGAKAWALLEKEGPSFHAILLDRIMPVMDGMEVLAKIKASESLQHIPVILQTSVGASENIQEGIDAGAFYYLTKPFSKEVLLAIVRAAVRDSLDYRQMQENLDAGDMSLASMQSGRFQVRTLSEVGALAIVLAKACPEPERVIMGLNDLLVNGVEHGNLGITYDDKTELQQTGQWEEEINRRLSLSENAHKWVEVTFERFPEEIHLTIKDQGPGFDWQPYLEMNQDLAFASHGRGIAMAKAMCFDHLEYLGNGSEVFCMIYTLPLAETDAYSVAAAGVWGNEA